MKCFSIGPEEIPRFLAVARRLNASDPAWVPALEAVVARELAGKDAFGAYGRMRLFLCTSDGEDVGRAAAIVNPRLHGLAGAPVGQIGYFECIDDLAAAGVLFEEASAWLHEEGAEKVWGPMNGGAHRLHRSLVDGFDRAPFLFEPRNPPHHPRLWHAHGFRVIHRWSTYEATLPQLKKGLFEELGMERAMKRVGKRFEISAPLMGDRATTLPRLHALLDAFWEGHVGYAPLSLEEFGEAFGGALAVMPDWCLGISVESATKKDAACAFMYPDWIEEARALDGDASGWGRWMSGPTPRRIVLHTLAAVEEARRAGAAHFILYNSFPYLERAGITAATIAMVTEEMRIFDRVASPTRRYALFGKVIT